MPRIVRFHRFGGPEVLQIEELPSEAPGPGQVRLRVEAFALNRADQLFRENRHSVPTGPLPSRIGYEAVGIVEALGPGVEGFAPGERVANIPHPSPDYGVYGEETVLPAYALQKVPDGVPIEEATSTWLQYTTAWGGLFPFGRLEAGHAVLVTAGSSGSAIGAIQMAKAAGARVIATTRTADKGDFVLSAGADAVIATEEQDVAAAILEATGGQGIDLAFDCVGGDLMMRYLPACRFGARIVYYGTLGGPTEIPLIPMALKEISLHPYSMPTVFAVPEKRQAGIAHIRQGLETGALRPIVGKVFRLDEIVEAHRYLERSETRGKIVVRV